MQWLLELPGILAAVILLAAFRNLFFQDSLLNAVPVVVPFENHRTAVYVFLIVISVMVWLIGLWLTLGPYSKRKDSRIAFETPVMFFCWMAVILVNAALSFFEIELINNYYLYRMDTRYVLLGIGITFVMYLFLVLALGSISIAMTIGNWFFLLWGTANYYVQQFRGIPFQWIDLGSIGTALSVSGNYDYTPNWQIIAGFVITIAAAGIYLHLRIWHNFRAVPGKLGSRGAALVLAVSFIGIIFHTDFLSNQGIWLRDWQPWYTYRLFGMESGFLAFAKASFPTAPDSYSAERVAEIISDSSANDSTAASETQDVPENIICIMNESFSDLSIYPGLTMNTDVMPFLNSMKGQKNTQEGRLLVSVKGGTTANTEYEFLTGNSTVLSPSTVVYNSYIKDDQYSLASTLAAQGYTALALHPYGRNGWNREIVYPKMGFEEFYSIENYFDASSYLRGFVSDQGDYDALIDTVEQKEPGEKLFLFNVTMQNHSPYTTANFDSAVTVQNYSGSDKAKAEQYLTLLKYSDDALRQLVEYFSNSDEKTMIVFWGDHQPEIGDDFWKYCLGKDLDDASFEEQQLMYETRYFIWTNYDVEGMEDQMLSANYLGSYMLNLAGLEQTGYNRFLLNQMESIPAMNAYGYLGTDGKQHQWDAESSDTEALKRLEDYKCLIYNELTADSGRDENFFGISSNGS